MRRSVAVATLFALLVALVLADDTKRTPQELEIARRMRQGTPGYGAPRPPGTLLLNMLIKNEAEHLDRTLPKWAKIIDYWIVGVDDKNTDNSPEIIMKHLGHIPGAIVNVTFDGMGPTWTILVEYGLKHFPKATHGIVADADFAPMQDTLDKMELDIRCSKHMYTIWTADHKNERKMDWIYRNIPGARVLRRTHQTVDVPEQPWQEVFQTLVNLHVDEREGGYQDRTPGKNQRYIKFLEDDLRDYPGDARTLYYLGYAHYDTFKRDYDHAGGKPAKSAWDELEIGMSFMRQRIANTTGNKEERWFTMLKMGEIHERYLRNWAEAESWYKKCAEDDPERADSFFYIGQHYRLAGDTDNAIKWLRTAATLPIPERSLFHWHYLYNCLSKLDFVRSMSTLGDRLTADNVAEALDIIKKTNCVNGEEGNLADLKVMKEFFTEKSLLLGGKGGRLDPKVKAVKKLVKILQDFEDHAAELKEVQTSVKLPNKRKPLSAHQVIEEQIETMQQFVEECKTKHKANKKDNPKGPALVFPCRDFRRATMPYFKAIREVEEDIAKALHRELAREWKEQNDVVRSFCR